MRKKNMRKDATTEQKNNEMEIYLMNSRAAFEKAAASLVSSCDELKEALQSSAVSVLVKRDF